VTAELACQRCREVTANPVIIYGRDTVGNLVPKQALCRGGCQYDRRPARSARSFTANPFPSNRPGKCTAGPRDIVPGDLIVRTGDNSVAPLRMRSRGHSQPPSQRRERQSPLTSTVSHVRSAWWADTARLGGGMIAC